jgi:hypothetical protein
MELLLVGSVFVVFVLAAVRFGADSRPSLNDRPYRAI